MMAHIKVKRKDIEKVFKRFKALKKGARWTNFLHVTCELTLIDGQLNICIPGANFSVTGETIGTAKASFDFYRFYHIICHYTHEIVTIEFLDEIVQIGVVQFKAQTTFFRTDKILRSVKLPYPYSDMDLIRLKTEGYTDEELEFNNLADLVVDAQRRVYYRIRRCGLYLNEIGISNKEIKQFVMEKLGVQLDLEKKELDALLRKD